MMIVLVALGGPVVVAFAGAVVYDWRRRRRHDAPRRGIADAAGKARVHGESKGHPH
jgi:hypothetical protein